MTPREKTQQSIKDGFGGDTYRRIEISPGVYQCGCKWERQEKWGDVLVQCPIHRAATYAAGHRR
jgi:hypothetical protein